MIAGIMCGGKSTRLKIHHDVEKPLLKINEITMIEKIIQTLLHTSIFSKIFLITSLNTPKTRSFLLSKFGKDKRIHILLESGDDYSCDLSRFLKNIAFGSTEGTFVLPADIPFVKSETIQKIIYKGFENDTALTTVLIEKSFVEKLGIKSSITKTINKIEYCYSGISLYNPLFANMSLIGMHQNDDHILLKESYLVLNESDIAVNINTNADFLAAKKLFY